MILGIVVGGWDAWRMVVKLIRMVGLDVWVALDGWDVCLIDGRDDSDGRLGGLEEWWSWDICDQRDDWDAWNGFEGCEGLDDRND